uniref:Apolipoprotein N-acyltransferase n=1 Tax=candidate division WOR-3 bacterium TaxID=2052148 RepID=A0A7C6AA25_UNCW3
MRKKIWLFLILSAFGLAFAFSPLSLRFLAYFALVSLFWVIENYSYKKTFWSAWFFGGLFGLFHLWWLYFLVVPVVPMTKFLLILGVTILFAYLGLYTALFAVITKYTGLIFAPFIWAGLEFIRTKTEIGFPWGLLGYTQTPSIPFIQIASIFGVYGISAWVVWINLLIYWIVKEWHSQKTPDFQLRILRWVLTLFLSVLIPYSYGRLRLKPNQDWFKVAIIQPNVSPNEKGDRESLKKNQSDLINLTQKAILARPSLIIYPETATLTDITQDKGFQAVLQKLVDSNKVYLLTGTPVYDQGVSGRYYNGAVLFEPGTELRQDYKKIHPVPFSEKIPYADRIPLFKKLETVDMGDMTPGKIFRVFNFPYGNLSVLICFESIFPDLTQEFTKRGADLLINITNDGWFGKTFGPYQHAELSILRTVENGVPLVRCANNGVSFIVDPYGRVLNKTSLFTQTVMIDNLPKPIKPTFFRRYGNIFAIVSLGLIGLGLVLRWIRKRNK